MNVSFDPLIDDEVNAALSIIIHTWGWDRIVAAATDQVAIPASTPTAEPVQTPVPNGLDTAAVAAAPASPTATVDATAGVPLDSNGTPWIAEVHAGTKSQTKDGVWKAKRGVDKEVVAQTEADARAKIAGTPQPTVPTEPVVPAAEQPAPVVTMEDLSSTWQAAMAAGVVDPNTIGQVYAEIQVDPGQFNTNETMRAAFVNHLKALMNPTPTSNVVNIPGMPQ